jgi:hypothetical protein
MAVTLLLTAALSGAAHAAGPITPPVVPGNIEAPAGTKPILKGHAVGTQNYICAPSPTEPGVVEWLFLGPQATVFGDDGQQILTHFLSMNPFKENAFHATWQHSRDTSIVWAKKFDGSLDPDYVAAGAIEWLLLEVTGARTGPAGGEKVSTSTFIQRVNTVGGVKPPADECTASTVTARRLVPYEADYYFYQ